MKILQIINSHALEDGGAQRLAQQFHRAYLESGHEAHLLSLMRSPTQVQNTHSLGFQTPYHAAVLPRLRAFLQQPQWKNLDIVHVHLFPAQVFVPLVLRSLRCDAPLVTTEHNTHNRRRESVLWRRFDRTVYRRYARIACISEGTHEAMARWLPETVPRLCTIPNGIELKQETFASTRASTRKPIILSLGRISEQKNYATAIRAVALLPRDSFELHIAGKSESESLMRQLQEMVRSLDLQNAVRFLGFREDATQLLQQADIYLSTSRWEGFGLAVAEAMAARLPVVAADVDGVREVVGNESGAARSGFLAQPESPQAFADALQTLLNDADLRRAVGENARRRAQTFDIENTIAAYLALYEEVLAKRSARKIGAASTRDAVTEN